MSGMYSSTMPKSTTGFSLRILSVTPARLPASPVT